MRSPVEELAGGVIGWRSHSITRLYSTLKVLIHSNLLKITLDLLKITMTRRGKPIEYDLHTFRFRGAGCCEGLLCLRKSCKRHSPNARQISSVYTLRNVLRYRWAMTELDWMCLSASDYHPSISVCQPPVWLSINFLIVVLRLIETNNRIGSLCCRTRYNFPFVWFRD